MTSHTRSPTGPSLSQVLACLARGLLIPPLMLPSSLHAPRPPFLCLPQSLHLCGPFCQPLLHLSISIFSPLPLVSPSSHSI